MEEAPSFPFQDLRQLFTTSPSYGAQKRQRAVRITGWGVSFIGSFYQAVGARDGYASRVKHK